MDTLNTSHQAVTARSPWELVRGDGEVELAWQGVTVRCLTRLDGSVPDSEDRLRCGAVDDLGWEWVRWPVPSAPR